MLVFILIVVLAIVALRWAFALMRVLEKVTHGRGRLTSVVKPVAVWLLATMLCLFSGCVTSYCTGFITIAKDYSQEATVGVISYKGFPVWFCEAASGISAISGWHPERVYINWYVWTIIFVIICCRLRFVKVKRT